MGFLVLACQKTVPHAPESILPPQQRNFTHSSELIFNTTIEILKNDFGFEFAFTNETDFRFSTKEKREASAQGPIKYRIVGNLKSADGIENTHTLTLHRQAELLKENIWIPLPSDGKLEADIFAQIASHLNPDQ